jgi:hypothetical protein
MVQPRDIILVYHRESGFIGASFSTIFTFLKDRFIREWKIRFRHILLGIAGCLTASATDTSGQVNQNAQGILILFYLM